MLELIAKSISFIFGWVYFSAWAISAYPQPLHNWRRKSTSGLTVDFPLLNVLGFGCYTLSTGAFYFSPIIRQEYAVRNPQSPMPTVRLNDFLFAFHGFILCIVTYSQFWHELWKFESIGHQRASRISQGIVWGCLCAIAVVTFIVMSESRHISVDPQSWAAIDIVYTASYIKLLVSCCKYLPQALYHYRTKSTQGWSIKAIQLDFVGGVLSIAQLLIDSALQADWTGVTGNMAKFGLGNVSMAFDIVFFVQHYYLYPTKDDSVEHPLLHNDEQSLS